jgi:hypothetical protein
VLPFSTVFLHAQVLPFSITIYRYGPGTRNQPYWLSEIVPSGPCYVAGVFPYGYWDTTIKLGQLKPNWWLCGTIPKVSGEPCAKIGTGAVPSKSIGPTVKWNTLS